MMINRREALRRGALLLGGALSSSAVAGVLGGCQAVATPDWEPAFLSVEQARMVDALVDRILPPTETPGARELGVGAFVDRMLDEYYLGEDQRRFVSGLEMLEAQALDRFGAPFSECRVERQDELIEALARGATAEERAFFQMAKELTVLGFFTTEAGATQVLQYELIPGGFRGCIPLQEAGGKTWAT